MCVVLAPAVQAALAIATTGFGIYQTNRAAKNQFQAQQQQAQHMLEEQAAKATEELGARMKEYRKVRARARVAGGESGAQGQSFAVGLNQLIQDQDETAGLVAKNLALGARSTITSLESANASVRSISGLEAGLQIAQTGAYAYYGAKAAQGSAADRPKTPKPTASSTSSTLPVAGQRVS